MNSQSYAETIGSELAYGECRRVSCPVCGHRDFMVGREPGRVWWYCFRATCGDRGLSGDARLTPAARLAAVPSMMPYEGAALAPTNVDALYFAERFDLSAVTVQKHVRVTENDEYLLPYRGPMGDIRGYVVRQPWWSGSPACHRKGAAEAGTDRASGVPKTKLYRHTTEPKLAWYSGEGGAKGRAHLFIVEDQISAMRIAQHLQWPAVALMGSGINAEGVRDIARARPISVTIALDPNAQGNAQQIRMKWGGYFERCRIVALEQDPKDVPMKELVGSLL